MDSHGALVGWSHQDLNEKLMLRIESVSSSAAVQEHAPDIMRLLLTKQQAGVLGNYLIEVSGYTPSKPGERGVLKRLFG